MSKTASNSKRARPLSGRHAVEGIIGKRCWRANFAYGGELHLHLGAHVAQKVPKLSPRETGSWRFGTCGTSWTLVTPKEIISSAGRLSEDLKTKIKALEGSRVSGFKVSLIARDILSIAFDNGCVLLVIPTAEDDKHDLPYWELFLPGHRMVTFGPCRKGWWAGRSDERHA